MHTIEKKLRRLTIAYLAITGSLVVCLGSVMLGTASGGSTPDAAAEAVSQASDPLFFGKQSHNFIIRWAFQDFCDYAFDPRRDPYRWPTDSNKGVTFNPADVQPGDVIFVRCVDRFFADMHPQIPCPYIIVTHGEHLEEMQKTFLPYLEHEKVIHWFGIHPCKWTHPKYTPIPIGVVQQPENYQRKKQLDAFFEQLRKTSKKEHLVYLNFADVNKPERKKVREQFIKKPYTKRGERQPFKSYLKEMATCKFALSPKGLGCDCYRTWEALLTGTIPIVRSSQLNPLYEDLPILVIDRWEDVDEAYLNKAYDEITSRKYDISKLYMEYWINKINAVRNEFKVRYGK